MKKGSDLIRKKENWIRNIQDENKEYKKKIVVENGHGDTSSNPGRDYLHFT